MKTPYFLLLVLTLWITGCAVNQVSEEEDPKVAAFTRGESVNPSADTDFGAELRKGPDDLRYQMTEKDPQFYDAVFSGRFLASNLSRFNYHHPEENWEGIHLEAIKTLEGMDENLDPRAKLSNLETIAFIVLDKYLNQVPINQSVAEATIYYLDYLQKSGSKVELVLVATSFQRAKPFLSPETAEKWSGFYNELFRSIQSSSGDNQYISYAAFKAEKILKSGL
ncbi:MAG TPA: hypothetical protein PKE06_07230 [Flavilitoribacter sp.]|nr:hypothetical protein [Flavilitoribacter sp.]HMQ87488.1 hypothetical protein [Flavilitoribacter sp.]